ncbi:MAG: hypothetical protein ABMB14_23295 [Myxococcota bacterium]
MWIWLVGCGTSVVTEHGELTVTSGLSVSADDRGEPASILLGTGICATLTCAADDCPKRPVADCFVVAIDGAAPRPVVAGSDLCVGFTTPGEAELTFAPRDCPATNLEGYAPDEDRLRFPVVLPGEVAASAVDLPARAAELLDPGPAGAFPSDWSNRGDLYQLAGPYTFSPALSLVHDGDPVGFDWSERRGVVMAGVGPITATVADLGIEVAVDPGGGGTIGLEVGGTTWPMVEVLGVDPSAAASLEVVAGYLDVEGDGFVAPVAARAIVRDANGDLLWGAPVSWSLDAGALAVGDPYAPMPGADHVTLLDVCLDPPSAPEARQARLRANLGPLQASVDLAWTAAPRHTGVQTPPISDFCRYATGTDPTTGTLLPNAPPGQFRLVGGCATAPGGGVGAGGAAAAAALVLARRRRIAPASMLHPPHGRPLGLDAPVSGP